MLLKLAHTAPATLRHPAILCVPVVIADWASQTPMAFRGPEADIVGTGKAQW